LKNTVLDSSALLAFLFNESGADRLDDLLEEAGRDERSIFMCDVNWAEVQYKMIQKRGADEWRLARSRLMAFPIEHVPADQLLAESAAEIKVAHKMSLADAFAAALARQKKATLFTGDHDFKALEGEIKVGWLK